MNLFQLSERKNGGVLKTISFQCFLCTLPQEKGMETKKRRLRNAQQLKISSTDLEIFSPRG